MSSRNWKLRFFNESAWYDRLFAQYTSEGYAELCNICPTINLPCDGWTIGQVAESVQCKTADSGATITPGGYNAKRGILPVLNPKRKGRPKSAAKNGRDDGLLR